MESLSDPIMTLAIRALEEARPSDRLVAAARMSKVKFARELGISQARLYQIFTEAEERGWLSVKWASEMARVVGCRVQDIYTHFGITREIEGDQAELFDGGVDPRTRMTA